MSWSQIIRKCLIWREMKITSAADGGSGGSVAVSSQFLNKLAEFLRVRFKK